MSTEREPDELDLEKNVIEAMKGDTAKTSALVSEIRDAATNLQQIINLLRNFDDCVKGASQIQLIVIHGAYHRDEFKYVVGKETAERIYHMEREVILTRIKVAQSIFEERKNKLRDYLGTGQTDR